MIKSWVSARSERFHRDGKNPFRGLDAKVAQRRIAMLDEVERLDEIAPLKSVGLHKLKGNRRGQWVMIINGPWRLCFRFRNGDAYDVEIVDYHKG